MAAASKVIASWSEQSRGQHETLRGQKAVTAQVRTAGVCSRTFIQAANLVATRR